MFDPWLVVAMVVAILITSGVKISIGDIHIGNKTNEKDDTE